MLLTIVLATRARLILILMERLVPFRASKGTSLTKKKQILRYGTIHKGCVFFVPYPEKNALFCIFFILTPMFWEFKAVPLQRKLKIIVPARDKNFKKYMVMLTYQLLKIAPDGGRFASTTLGLLFGLMEVGLAGWFLISLIMGVC